jgi:hypothetical protein
MTFFKDVDKKPTHASVENSSDSIRDTNVMIAMVCGMKNMKFLKQINHNPTKDKIKLLSTGSNSTCRIQVRFLSDVIE